MKPLLSIVIPTKDRYIYLEALLRLIKGFNREEIEIVVQDNTADNKPFLDFLSTFEYHSLVYDHTPNQIPISDNSDKAILNSNGEYVCFLGDDDGIVLDIVKYVYYMKDNDIEAMKFPELVHYNWPDYGGPLSGVCIYGSYDGKVVYKDSRNELIKLAKRGFIDRGEIPVVYHGIVKRSALDKIYEKCNTYFPGQSPDISNGVALSLVVNRYCYVNNPVIIAGASIFHGGGEHMDRVKYLDIDARPWLRPVASQRWDKRLPMIGVGPLIWAESAVTALKEMGEESFISRYVDFNKITAFIYVYYSDLKDLIGNNYRTNRMWLKVISLTTVRIINAVKRLILKHIFNSEKQKIESNIKDIIEASAFYHKLVIDKL